jgi:hypothetical protein
MCPFGRVAASKLRRLRRLVKRLILRAIWRQPSRLTGASLHGWRFSRGVCSVASGSAGLGAQAWARRVVWEGGPGVGSGTQIRGDIVRLLLGILHRHQAIESSRGPTEVIQEIGSVRIPSKQLDTIGADSAEANQLGAAAMASDPDRRPLT